MIGTNDIGAIEDDLWWRVPGKDEREVVEKSVENITEMVTMCRDKGQKITLCSIMPSDTCLPYKNEERKRLTLEINGKIKEICEQFGLTYVDYFQGLCKEDGKTLIYDYSPDGIHPNAKGYVVMANILRETLGI